MAPRPWLALVVEFYVPPDGDGDAVVRAARESFRPLLRLLDRQRHAQLTIAIDPGLTQMLLRHGQGGIVQEIAATVERTQVELAGGALNHALLPRLPRAEVERQIRRGHEVMSEALGRSWRPRGLLPPALGWSRQVGEIAADRGMRWVLADELSLGRPGLAPRHRVGALRGRPDVLLFFRDRSLSEAIARGEGPAMRSGDGHRVAVVPGTAFREGNAAMQGLERLLSGDGPLLSTLTTLASAFPDREPVEPLPCSWRTTPAEMAAGIPFAAWSSPDNEIQAMLWKLVGLGLAEAERLASEEDSVAYFRLRTLLDEGLHTAPFRYASARPWWRPQVVREAARRLAGALEASPELVDPDVLDQAREIRRLIDEAIERWERHRIPDRWRGATEEPGPELAG